MLSTMGHDFSYLIHAAYHLFRHSQEKRHLFCTPFREDDCSILYHIITVITA